MSNFSDLVTYFENLATNHLAINHSFTDKHFFRFEIDEVLAGLNRQDVNFPMLIMEGYSFGYTDNRADNIVKNRQGAFILLGMVPDHTDYDTVHETWDTLEQIGDDLLARIRYDKQQRLEPAVRNFNIESVTAQLIMNEIGNHAGIRYSFTISSLVSSDIDTAKWADITL